MKQIIAVRTDLEFTKKELLQVIVWASLFSSKTSIKEQPKKFELWMRKGKKKLVLKIGSLQELLKLKEQISHVKGISFIMIETPESMRHRAPVRELLALGIGPEKENVLDKFTNKFKLL